tara:strand:+ start:20544 stop:20810 length:267 start_codon:yes stop_codon:yes gene_type:complete
MTSELKPHERVKACGAKARSGHPCKGFAMKNGRCKFHGGMSTGPKTDEGKQRISDAHFKHGRYSNEAKAMRRVLKQLGSEFIEITASI